MKKLYLCWALLGLLIAPFTWAQNNVTGTVNDETGAPLPGATVIVEGTSRGVATDFDGNFSINAKEGEVLIVTYVGYSDYRLTVDSQDNYEIDLSTDNALDEVILTALGLEKKKDDDLSSTSVVQVDQLQKSGESGVLQGLSGKTSGVNITRNSGDPGSGAYIQIRGQNTINGDNSPLIVLDGAIISNSNIGVGTAGVVQQSRLNDINPDDIESISVIKGASAAAIYGTGAANGVLVIKTKTGAKGNIGKGWSVNVKSQLSVDEVNIEWEKQSTWGQGFDGIWFGDPGVGRFSQTSSFPLASYYENQLILAEAKFKTNDEDGARMHLNNVRAELRNQYSSDENGFPDSNATGDTLLEQILEEKYITLVGEIVTFHDLRRTRNFIGVPNKTTGSTGASDFPQRFLYPQSEVDTNSNVPSPLPEFLVLHSY